MLNVKNTKLRLKLSSFQYSRLWQTKTPSASEGKEKIKEKKKDIKTFWISKMDFFQSPSINMKPLE